MRMKRIWVAALMAAAFVIPVLAAPAHADWIIQEKGIYKRTSRAATTLGGFRDSSIWAHAANAVKGIATTGADATTADTLSNFTLENYSIPSGKTSADSTFLFRLVVQAPNDTLNGNLISAQGRVDVIGFTSGATGTPGFSADTIGVQVQGTTNGREWVSQLNRAVLVSAGPSATRGPVILNVFTTFHGNPSGTPTDVQLGSFKEYRVILGNHNAGVFEARVYWPQAVRGQMGTQ